MPYGRAFAVGIVTSLISPVAGFSRPTKLAYMPAHQIVPSAVCSGSRGRWPSVCGVHSSWQARRSPHGRSRR
jgi:hypothetical protein